MATKYRALSVIIVSISIDLIILYESLFICCLCMSTNDLESYIQYI